MPTRRPRSGRRYYEEVKPHMPSTGHKCTQSGIYANDCHAKRIALSVGETFPPCSDCLRAANWTLVQAT